VLLGVFRGHTTTVDAFNAEQVFLSVIVTTTHYVSALDLPWLGDQVGSGWFEKLVPVRVELFTQEELSSAAGADIAAESAGMSASLTEQLDAKLSYFAIRALSVTVRPAE